MAEDTDFIQRDGLSWQLQSVILADKAGQRTANGQLHKRDTETVMYL